MESLRRFKQGLPLQVRSHQPPIVHLPFLDHSWIVKTPFDPL